MKFSKYEQYINHLNLTKDENSRELVKQLRRFDDADKRRAKKMQNIHIVQFQDGETEADIVNYNLHESEVETQSLTNIYAGHLDGALAQLNDIQLMVVQKFFLEGCSQHEIAEGEKLHRSTVSYNLKGALKKMREYLKSVQLH